MNDAILYQSPVKFEKQNDPIMREKSKTCTIQKIYSTALTKFVGKKQKKKSTCWKTQWFFVSFWEN